ncbi:MAG: flagellar filament capping protein FliD [Pseudazoarcus pumilus]|nr:flagellar filament capping protein FliD [Pseudazoarcus pumilus]
MAITVSGLGGSGLDVDGLVTQLMAAERQPLTQLATREAGVQAKISAFGSMASAVANLQTAANGLNSAAKFAATKATVSGSNAGFTATSTTNAATGNYAIKVNTLAAAQRVALSADAFTQDGENIAAGTLTFNFGTADNLLADEPVSTETLDFAGGSLQDLRDAINDADIGLSANIINDGTTDRLILSSAETGAAQAFSIDGIGVAFSPDAPGAEGDAAYRLEAASDASITVDGLNLTRASNTISDVIEGVTLNLTATSDAANTLRVTADNSTARAAIDAFVTAYNGLAKGLTDSLKYDPESGEAALLNGDSTARAVQSQLRSIVGGAFAGLGGVERLADIGISFQLDGTLSVDSTKLNAAFDNPDVDVAGFFTGNGETSGFGKQVADSLGRLIGTDGLITGRTEGLKESVKTLQQRSEALTLRLETVEKRYRAQFTALDVMLSNMLQTSNYLQQQLANLPGASN